METNNFVLVEHFCSNCDVELSFINSLNDYGLIDVIILEDKKYISNALNRPMDKIKGNKTLERFQVNKIITFASIIVL